MLKVTKYELINDDMIEAICTYGTDPLRRIAVKGEAEGKTRRLRGRYKAHSLIICKDGTYYICPFKPETYLSKLNPDDYISIEARKYLIKKSEIREITTWLNASQQEEMTTRMEQDLFYDLTRGRKLRSYIITRNGHMYRTRYCPEL